MIDLVITDSFSVNPESMSLLFQVLCLIRVLILKETYWTLRVNLLAHCKVKINAAVILKNWAYLLSQVELYVCDLYLFRLKAILGATISQ